MEGISAKEIIRKKLTNNIILIGAALAFLNTILNALNQEWEDVIVAAGIVAAFGVIFFLIRLGYDHIARVTLLVAAISVLAFIRILYGPELKLEPVYIVFLLSSTITFDTTRMKLLSLIFIISAYFLSSFADPDRAIYASQVNGFGNIMYFIFSVLLTYWMVNTLLKLHHQQSEQLKTQADGLKKIINSTAHNLKTPINNVINISQLIELKIGAKNASPEIKEYFSLLDQSSKDIDNRITELQDQIVEQKFENIK